MLFGWDQWNRVRRAIWMNDSLQFDYFLRTRTDSELNRRVETLMKTIKKERMEWKEKQRILQDHQEKEKRDLEERLKLIEEEEKRLSEGIKEKQKEVEVLRERVNERRKEWMEGESKLEGLRAMQIPKSMLLELLPLLEELYRGMIGNQHEVEVYLHTKVPSLPIRSCKDLLSLVTEKREGMRGVVFLRSSLVNPVTKVIDLSSELDVDDEIKEKCLELSRKRESSECSVDVKRIVGEWERETRERKERLLEMMNEKGDMDREELFSEDTIRRVGGTKEEFLSLVGKVLMMNPVGKEMIDNE